MREASARLAIGLLALNPALAAGGAEELLRHDTHGSMVAWKSHGRLRAFPGHWALMTGQFSQHPLTMTALDLYGNESAPSEAVRAP